MYLKTISRLLLLVVSISHFNCSPNQIKQVEIPMLTGSDSGFSKALKLAAGKKQFRSLLISVDGHLEREQYFQKYNRDSLDHLRSASKSIMTTLIGIAIDKQFIPNLDVPISKYLLVSDEQKAKITIRHLASMTSGLEWDEGMGYNDNNEMIDSGNPVQYVLDNPLLHEPGTSWNYSTGDIHLLSAILSEATGMNTLKFAKKFLFKPLNIEHMELQRFGDGYYSGGSRLQLKPRDMLKIGQLYAQGGVYGGNRIVSAAFVEEATSLQNPDGAFPTPEEGYGLGWWVGKPMGMKAYMASGYAGQTIAVVPQLKLVMVMTQNWKVSGTQALKQQDDVQEIAQSIVEAALAQQGR